MIAKAKKKVKKKAKPNGPEIFCSYTKLERLDKIKPNPANPNKHPDGQVDLLVKLITTHGWRHPITVSNRSGFVVAGHCRLLAAAKIGLKQVPVDEQDFASAAEELAVLVADNRIPELSEISGLAMADILCEIDQANYPLEMTALSAEEIHNYIIGPTNMPKPEDEWRGMPEYDNEDKLGFRQLIVHFLTQKAIDEFCSLVQQKITDKTKYIWFPKEQREIIRDKAYKNEP